MLRLVQGGVIAAALGLGVLFGAPGAAEAAPLDGATVQQVQYYYGAPRYAYPRPYYARPYYRPYPRFYARHYYGPRPFYGRPYYHGRPYGWHRY